MINKLVRFIQSYDSIKDKDDMAKLVNGNSVVFEIDRSIILVISPFVLVRLTPHRLVTRFFLYPLYKSMTIGHLSSVCVHQQQTIY